jgi:putative acetyltransferase
MNIQIVKTDSSNADFQQLVNLLDADLAIRDGDEHAFYHQFNLIDSLIYCVIAYKNNKAVGCGAIKNYGSGVMELKRMFVLPEERGKKIATLLLDYLENWSKELGSQKCILETGVNQKEAIGLYHKCNYSIIKNYGQYENANNSICFEKLL